MTQRLYEAAKVAVDSPDFRQRMEMAYRGIGLELNLHYVRKELPAGKACLSRAA